MEIDWTTFALEIVNFLALVWILKRFLFQPVRDALARRQAGIETSLAEGRATAAQAEALKHQFEARLADWETEKAAARTAFDAELAAERERRLQALQRSLEDERARQLAQDEHRREASRHELETRALAQAQRFAAGLLARLAGSAIDARLVELFVEDLDGMPEAQLDGLRTSVDGSALHGSVVSATLLDPAQRAALAEVIARRVGHPVPLDFSEDPTLVAGLRVNLGPWQLKANLADELSFFAAAANHAS